MKGIGPRDLDPELLRFIDQHIDSIPELEALLLLRETAPSAWETVSLARRLYVSQDDAELILAKLRHMSLVVGDEARGYLFDNTSPKADVIARLADTYRKQLSAVTVAVHDKPARSVREFARAFEVTKDRKK